MNKKAIFIYRTRRLPVINAWKKREGPDSILFGFNHMKKFGISADFFDTGYSPLNIFHPVFYLLEHAIIAKIGMGFKTDQALALLPKLNKYNVIVSTGDSAGLPILFLKYLKIINKPVICMTAGLAGELKGKSNSWVGNFYKKILPMADVFTSYAQVEIDFFEKEMGIKKGKVKYMPLATDYKYFSKKSQPKVKKEIICAVGTEQGRDYKTLFEAVRDLPVTVEVVCHPDNIEGLNIPANVKIRLNIPIQEVLKIYQRSIISIVPCFERYRSSGQMVLLESAAAGLPVIASEIRGITTAFYFKHSKHLVFTKPEDSKDLREKIKMLLENRALRERIAKNGSILVKQNYTTYHLSKRLAEFIDNI